MRDTISSSALKGKRKHREFAGTRYIRRIASASRLLQSTASPIYAKASDVRELFLNQRISNRTYAHEFGIDPKAIRDW